MFRESKQENMKWIVEETPHYFASAEVDVIDNRAGTYETEQVTVFFEVGNEEYGPAKDKLRVILLKMGYTIANVGKIIITEVPIDSGKFWVTGKGEELK